MDSPRCSWYAHRAGALRHDHPQPSLRIDVHAPARRDARRLRRARSRGGGDARQAPCCSRTTISRREGEKRPIVLVRSPYGRAQLLRASLFGRLWQERGFQVLMQSCRGGLAPAATATPSTTSGPTGSPPSVARAAAVVHQGDGHPGAGSCLEASCSGPSRPTRGPSSRRWRSTVSSSEFRSAIHCGGSFWLDTASGDLDLPRPQPGRSRPSRCCSWRAGRPASSAASLDQLPLRGTDEAAVAKPVPSSSATGWSTTSRATRGGAPSTSANGSPR